MAYSVSFSNQTLTAARSVWFVNPKASGAGSIIQILRMSLSQSGSTTSAMERIQIYTQTSTFPTLTSATPVSMNAQDGASGITGGTAGAAGTTGIAASAEGAGTKTIVYSDAFNVLNGWLYVPVPEERPTIGILGTAQGLGLWFPAGPATLTGWSFSVVWREVNL
jgi:hypothetical protein